MQGFLPPFVLYVRNGALDASNRVSSATVSVDGVPVLQPRQFSPRVTGYAIPVSLRPQGVVEMRLESRPGAEVTIWIAGSPHLAVRLDEAWRVSQLVTPDGGTLTAFDGLGTEFTLSIPPGALLRPQSISMTPIAAIPNAPLRSGFRYGVEFGPDGLRLLRAATLQIRSPHLPARHALIGFGYLGRGDRFHLQPFNQLAEIVEIPIIHFSGVGLGEGTSADAAQVAATQVRGSESQYQSEVLSLLASWGLVPGDDLVTMLTAEQLAVLESLFSAWSNALVVPTLQRVLECGQTDCPTLTNLATEAFSVLVWWKQLIQQDGLERDSVLTTLDARMLARFTEDFASLVSSLDNRCAAADFCARPAKMITLLEVVRVVQPLLSVSEPPDDKICGGLRHSVVSHIGLAEPSLRIEIHKVAEAHLILLDDLHAQMTVPPPGTFEWTTDDPQTASADAAERTPLVGEVLGNRTGATQLHAGVTQCGTEFVASISITVTPVIASIQLEPATLTEDVGDEKIAQVILSDSEGHEVSVEQAATGEHSVAWSIVGTTGVVSVTPDIDAVRHRFIGRIRGLTAGDVVLTVSVAGVDQIQASMHVTVSRGIAGITLTPSDALLRNDATELTLAWQFVNSDGKPVPAPQDASATWSANRSGILVVVQRDLQHAVVTGVAPGRTTLTVDATYSRGTLRATATIDVFEEGIYRYQSSSITTTGVSRGEVWHCADTDPDSCAWVPFSCTLTVDSIFDPASAVRVMTRPLNDFNNVTSVVRDGGLGGGTPLRVIVNEVGHELSREGPACLAPDTSQAILIPAATQITPSGQQIYPISGMGLLFESGTSHVTSWIGGVEDSATSSTPVRSLWPVDVTYDSLTLHTQRSWTASLPGSGDFYRNLSWSSQVDGELKLLRQK